MEGVFSNILENIAEVMSAVICEGGIGAIGTDDDCKYYLLEWTGLPYRLEEDLVENGDRLSKGEHVCRARYLLKLPRTTKWYYQVPDGEEFTVRLQTVLAGEIELIPESETNKLPTYWRGRRETIPTAREDKRLIDADHDRLLEELERRDAFDYEEAFSDTDADGSDSNEENESSSEESENE
jgi:hypothetical protein